MNVKLGQISANNYLKDEYVELIQTVGYEKLYDKEGNLLQDLKLDLQEYRDRIQTFKSERLQYHQFKMKQELEKEINFFSNELPSSFLLQGDGPPELDIPPGGGGTPPDENCSVYAYVCEKTKAYNAEYTTHTTRVRVYPNNNTVQYPSVKIFSELKWDIMPRNRLIDAMAVSFEEIFKAYDSSIKGKVVSDYSYSYLERYNNITLKDINYNDKKTEYFNINSVNIEKSTNGVIFNANLLPYNDMDSYYQEGLYLIKEKRTFYNLKISLEVDLHFKNYNSIKDSSLSSADIMAEYVHFWEELHIKPSFNIGFGFKSGGFGLNFEPIFTLKHDNPRRNYFQFLFLR